MPQHPTTRHRLRALFEGRRWLFGTTLVALLLLALAVVSHDRWPWKNPTSRDQHVDAPFDTPIRIFEREPRRSHQPPDSQADARPSSLRAKEQRSARAMNPQHERSGAQVQSNTPVAVPVVKSSEEAFFQPRGAWLSGTIEPVFDDAARPTFSPAEPNSEPVR